MYYLFAGQPKSLWEKHSSLGLVTKIFVYYSGAVTLWLLKEGKLEQQKQVWCGPSGVLLHMHRHNCKRSHFATLNYFSPNTSPVQEMFRICLCRHFFLLLQLLIIHALFFEVLLTVHLSIFFSVINQLDAQNLFHNKFYFMPLHVSSTCGRNM